MNRAASAVCISGLLTISLAPNALAWGAYHGAWGGAAYHGAWGGGAYHTGAFGTTGLHYGPGGATAYHTGAYGTNAYHAGPYGTSSYHSNGYGTYGYHYGGGTYYHGGTYYGGTTVVTPGYSGWGAAARYLSRAGDPCQPNSRIWLTAEGYAKNLATSGAITGGPPRIRGWTPAMVSLRCTAVANPVELDGLPAYRGAGLIPIVTVSTRFPDPSLGFFRVLGLRPPLIAVSHSERATGPG